MKSNNLLAGISSIEEAKKAIQIVKKRIEIREEDLGEYAKQLPEETIQLLTSSVFPSMISKQFGGSIWTLLSKTFQLFAPSLTSNKKQNDWKSLLPQLGLMTLMALSNKIFTKKQQKNEA